MGKFIFSVGVAVLVAFTLFSGDAPGWAGYLGAVLVFLLCVILGEIEEIKETRGKP